MNNKGTTLLIVILSILVIVAGGMLIYKIINEKEESENVVADDNVDINEDKDDKELVVEEKKPQIFNGNDRPIAVMIDNHSGAWPQANLNKAYLVYEIIVEGGETRLMAVFKGQDLEKIGPIRSSRHYFLDYALENDAIYVHHGWSPQAQNDISALNVNNINGIQESSNNFWRVKDKKSPHNMFTSTTSILKIAERKGYATISDKKSVLNYIAGDVDLKEKYGIAEEQTENTSAESKAINATKIVIPHSTLQTVEYDYDENSKTYVRYARGKVQTDYITGENIQTKNIIITMCDNYTLADSEEKGRQGLKNIGTFDGYYITNGYAIPIKCEKESRTAQTQYKDLKGNAIEVSDGNTFINICPQDAKIVLKTLFLKGGFYLINKVEISSVNTSQLPILTNKEKEELFIRIKQGDENARTEFIKGNLRLVLSVIQRFYGRGESADDLFQIGCIGLIKAIDNFDLTQGVQFSTYAVPMIIRRS